MLRLGHRRSDDLDWAWVGRSDALPRAQLRQLALTMADQGWAWQSCQRPENLRKARDTGLDLDDYQQVHRVGDEVQLTLVSLDPALRSLLRSPRIGAARVASLDELLATKLYAAAKRARVNDWLDIHELMSRHGYHLGHAVALFRRLERPDLFQSLLTRLRECRTGPGAAGEPSIEAPREVRAYFCRLID